MNRAERRRLEKQAKKNVKTQNFISAESALEQAHTLYNQAVDYKEQGKFDKAISNYRQAIKLKADFPEAYVNLGNIYEKRVMWQEAESAYRSAFKSSPENALLLSNLGNVLWQLKKNDEAVEVLTHALEIEPDHLFALNNLGNTYVKQQNYTEALKLFRRALEIDPSYIETYINFGSALDDAGEYDEAINVLEKAITINSKNAVIHYNLGHVLHNDKQYEKAVIAYEKAIQINPKYGLAFYNMGGSLEKLYQFANAAKAYHRSLELMPDNGAVYLNLGGTLLNQGKLTEAIKIYQQGLKNKKLKNAEAHLVHSNLLFTMNYSAFVPQKKIYEEHISYDKRYAKPLSKTIKSYSHSCEQKRKLKIGYVSADFRQHSVAYFLEPILSQHNIDVFEIYCYSDVSSPDDTTERLQAMVEVWRDIFQRSDDDVADLIRDDGIDILIDLAGHTGAGERMLLFARKPAPVQVTYLGYPNTTGLSTIDYRLTDARADPVNNSDSIAQQNYYSETLVRLQEGFLCYHPPADSPAVSGLPVKQAGHITFGSFNNLSKMVPEVVSLWSRLLLQVSNSRLLIKNQSFRDESIKEDYYSLFEQNGIERERIELIGWLPKKEDHLGLYSRIDIALDTFPYNGTTTTCEALWMGVPVITLEGQFHAARVGVSLLSQVGLENWIATSEENYVELAVKWASGLSKLSDLRSAMRDRLLNSPLCDESGFTRALEKELQRMWNKWCDKQNKN